MSDVGPATGLSDDLVCQVCGGHDFGSYSTDPRGNFVRCAGCGLIVRTGAAAVSVEDEADQEEYRRIYERRHEHKLWSQGRRLDVLLHYVTPPPDGPVRYLDIGCGLGAAVEAAALRGLSAHGIDIGAYAVGYCREEGLNVGEGGVTDTGYEDQSLDLVTALEVLEHIPETAAGLREVYRILRPGGVFGLSVPNGRYLKAHLLRGSHRDFHGLRAGVHQVYHSPRTMAILLRRAGFEVLPYPWLVRPRLAHPLQALSELLGCLPRKLLIGARSALALERNLFMIARRPVSSGGSRTPGGAE